jgi:hypothetical protein
VKGSFTEYDWYDASIGPEDVLREQVAVGIYRFGDARRLLGSAAFSRPGFAGEAQISDVLNAYGGMNWDALDGEWYDVGDVPALARTNREFFIARDFHGVSATEPGVITKTGASIGEVNWMLSPPGDSRLLVPRAWVNTHDDLSTYRMEYIDYPSLAELWLYWPSTPSMWEHVGANLVMMLRQHLWSKYHGFDRMLDKCDYMYRVKLLERYADWPECLPADEVLHINGRAVAAGPGMVSAVAQQSVKLAKDAALHTGFVHGDPTFSNILWSLKSGTFKLLDPRGDFGVDHSGPAGDIRYDVAKVLNGPVMAQVMHDLFDVHGDGDTWNLRGWNSHTTNHRQFRRAVLDASKFSELDILQTNQLLASAPLHPPKQARALYLLGCLTAAEALSNSQA